MLAGIGGAHGWNVLYDKQLVITALNLIWHILTCRLLISY